MSNLNFDQMVESHETGSPATKRRQLRRSKGSDVVIGGLPTVSLLPRELLTAAREKSIRRALAGAVIVAVVVAGGGVAAATAIDGAAQQRLASANTRAQALLVQTAKFKDVQILQQSIALGAAAKTVGSSAEIDWQAQIDAIEQDMPAGYTIDTIAADSATAIADYPQGTTPLDRPRAASLDMTIATRSISELPIWLRKLRSIPAYADATASVSSDDTNGYSVQLTVHLSPKALIDTKKAAE